MATVVQTQRFTAANSGTLSTPLTAGNSLVVVFIGSAGAGSTGTCSTSGATLDGVPMIKLAELDAPGSASAGCIAYYMAANVTGGQSAIVVSGTSLVSADSYICAYELGQMGTAPTLHQIASLESHSGTTSWSSDAGTAPATTQTAVWIGAHAAGPNSGQPDTFTPAGSWTNQTQFNWGSPGGASISGHQVAAAGSLRYNGTSADFDFYLTLAIALVPGDTYVRPGGKFARKRRLRERAPVQQFPPNPILSFPFECVITETASATSFQPVTTQAGDWLVVTATIEDRAGTLAVSATGLTFTAVADSGGGATGLGRATIFAAQDAAGGTRTVQMTQAGFRQTGHLTVVRGATGVGAVANALNAQTAAITLTGNDSALFAAIDDWNTTAPGASQTWAPAGATVQVQQGAGGTEVHGVWRDTGVAQAWTAGLATPSLGAKPVLALAEILSGGTPTTPIALADSGTGTDVITASADTALGEAGTGTDALAVTSSVAFTDAGTATDALSVALAIALAEAGAGTDALTVTSAVPFTDAGTGTDALAVASAIAFTDAGTGTDVLSVLVPVALTDTGTGTDVLAVSVPIALADAGAGTDTLAVVIATAIALADAGTGTDALGVTSSVALADAGVATDALQVAAAVAFAEAGIGTDSLKVTASVALTDAGTGTDSVGVAVPIALSDAGAGLDVLSVVTAIAIALSDAGHGTDVLSANIAVGLADTGAGTDSLAVQSVAVTVVYGTASAGGGPVGGGSVGSGPGVSSRPGGAGGTGTNLGGSAAGSGHAGGGPAGGGST